MKAQAEKRLYLIPVLSKALDILEILQTSGQAMTLTQLHEKTRFSKTTVFRIIKTFVHRGYVAQMPNGAYRYIPRQKKLRFGFGCESADMPFSNEVTQSLQEAAARSGIDLLVLDNQYDPRAAVTNADEFIRQAVDLVIELQVEQEVAPLIGDKIAAAGIPLIAVDIPHPNAIYFGVDNFRVGVEAGELLAQHAIRNWKTKVDWVLGLDLNEAGPMVQGRVTGAFEAIRQHIPHLPPEKYIRADGRGMREKSRKITADFLARHPKDRHILIMAATDTSALGAVEAIRAVRREQQVAVAGQDCIAEAIEEMKRPRSPLIGSVSHEAASYGPALIELGLAILQGQTVPPYNYIAHKTISRDALLHGFSKTRTSGRKQHHRQ